MIDKDRIVEKNWKLYKLNLIIDKTATDIHHILGQCNKNKYNVNADVNKIRMNKREHVALNQFFQHIQEARGQLIKVFEIVKPVLSPWVRNELSTILYKTDDEMFYTPEVLKWKKKKKNDTNTNTWESVIKDSK